MHNTLEHFYRCSAQQASENAMTCFLLRAPLRHNNRNHLGTRTDYVLLGGHTCGRTGHEGRTGHGTGVPARLSALYEPSGRKFPISSLLAGHSGLFFLGVGVRP